MSKEVCTNNAICPGYVAVTILRALWVGPWYFTCKFFLNASPAGMLVHSRSFPNARDVSGGHMSSTSGPDPVSVRLPRRYDVELLKRDLEALCEVRRAAQPGPYHQGEWTGIALHSMGGKQ